MENYSIQDEDGSLWSLAYRDNKARAHLARSIKIWGRRSGGKLITYPGHQSGVRALAWSPDSSKIAFGGYDGTVQIWNPTNGSHILTLSTKSDSVVTMAWSPDGEYIASGSDDKTVRVWSAITGNDVLMYRGHSNTVITLCWSFDSKRIASGSDRVNAAEEDGLLRKNSTVQIWDANTGGNVVLCDNSPFRTYAISWSPDASYIVIGSMSAEALKVYDSTTGEDVAILDLGNSFVESGQVLSVAWSPDGTRIAAGFSSGIVQVWSTD